MTYNDTFIDGNITEVHPGKFFRFPPVLKHECIHYCLRSFSCDAIFVTYKSNSPYIESCNFFKIGLTLVDYVPIKSNMSALVTAAWPFGNQLPDSSELIVIGKFG